MPARRGRESRASHGVGASNLPGSEDQTGLSALPLLHQALALRRGALLKSPPLAGRFTAPGPCSSPGARPTCSGRGFRRDTLTVVVGRLGLRRPGSLGGCSPRVMFSTARFPLASPAPALGSPLQGTRGQATGVGAGAICRERARARSQTAPGETIARTAGERGEAISRTAGALHGARGSPAPARTLAQAAGSSRSAESPSRQSQRAGRREPTLPPYLPPFLPPSSRLRAVRGVLSGPRGK